MIANIFQSHDAFVGVGNGYSSRLPRHDQGAAKGATGREQVREGHEVIGDGTSASKQIDAIVTAAGGWQEQTLAHARAAVRTADPTVVEEVKWKKPSNPMGNPVWSSDGIICVGNTLKRAVRLTFPKGALLDDREGLFNARLESKTVRAIDYREGDTVDQVALTGLVVQAIRLNSRSGR